MGERELGGPAGRAQLKGQHAVLHRDGERAVVGVRVTADVEIVALRRFGLGRCLGIVNFWLLRLIDLLEDARR